jgi:hypothetical protein
MKKHLIKIFSFIMAMLVVLSVSTVAFAETDNSEDTSSDSKYSVINSTAVSLTIRGLTAECSSKITAQYSTSLHIKMELQKKSGGTYSTVRTWTKSANGVTTTLAGSKIINPLSTYRLKVTFTAGSETSIVYKS